MNNLLFAAIVALCGGTARADISDSGNATFGGQLIVAGTATVQGNAFGVGRSTFVVANGRVAIGTTTPTSALHIVDGDIRFSTTSGSGRGIIFADGTTQTTASGGTGAVVFTSSITVGPTTDTTAADYRSVIINGWSVVANTRVAAASSVSFTNLYSTYTYRLHWSFVQTTSAGQTFLRFNGSSSSNYRYAVYGIHTSGGGANAASGASDTQIVLSGNVSPAAGVHSAGHLTIYSIPDAQSTTSNTIVNGLNWSGDATPTYHMFFIGGQHASGPLSSLQVHTAAGGMKGHLWLEASITEPR